MRQRSKTLVNVGIAFVLFLPILFPVARCSASVKNLLELPEDKIDIGLVALTLAKEVSPDIDIASYSNKIDALAEKVRRLAKGSQDPDHRVRCLNTVILLHEKIQGTRDLASARNFEKYYLDRVLDTKQGNCVSLPMLYIAVSQRLGWPVYLVHVPDHSFVRYVDPLLKEQNIEATSNGGFVSDDEYAQKFLVSEKGRKSGTYLRTLTHRETTGDLVAVNGITFGQQGDTEKSIAYLRLATRLNPRNAAAWSNLIIAHKIAAKRSNGAEAKRNLDLAAKYSRKLDQLGFVHPKDVPQFTSTRRPQ